MNHCQYNAVKFIRAMSLDNVFAFFNHDPSKWPLLVPTSGEVVTFILDASCSSSYRLLSQVNKTRLFKSPHRWLLLFNSEDNTPEVSNETSSNISTSSPHLNFNGWTSLLNSLHLHVDSDVMIGNRISGSYVLLEIYKCADHFPLKLEVLGYWRRGSGIEPVADYVAATRRFNVDGAPLTTAFVVSDNDTLNHLTDLHNIHIDSVTKANYKVIYHLCELLNASFRAIYGTSWGYPENGTWNGVVGHLIRKEADIAGTSFLFIKERAEIIDFILLLVPTKLAFVFRQPPLSSVTNVFVLPFSKEVWGCSVAVLAACGIVLYLNFMWEHTHQAEGAAETDGDVESRVTWSDIIMYVVGAITEQGTTFEPQKTPGRIISIFLYISTIFLVTSYGACIVALLQTPTNTIKSLKDLLESPVDVAGGDTLYNKFYFESATDPIKKEIYEKKIAPKGHRPNYYPLAEGVKRMKKGLFAFHYEVGPLYQLISTTFLEDEKCGLSVIDFVEYNNAYQAVQKGSPYKEIITIGFRKIYERGLFSRSWNRYYSKMPQCVSGSSNFMSIGLTEFYPALLVLGYGIAASVIVLILEILTNCRNFIKSRVKLPFKTQERFMK